MKKTMNKLCKVFLSVVLAGCLSVQGVGMGTAEAAGTAEEMDDTKAILRSFSDTGSYPSLKELYKNEFLVGAAVSDEMIRTSVYSDLIQQQFSSITMENEMKPAYILDEQTSKSDLAAYKERVALNFDSYKQGMEYAKKHGIKMRGHTFVWHSQTPDWFFYEDYDTSGALAGRELMLKRMENYIKEVIAWTETNYPGVIYAWDVVNEAVAEPWGNDADKLMRQEGSMWYQTIGEDFVEKAFAYARKYTKEYALDHKIKLFYNDYNEYFAVKRDRIVELLKPVKEAGNIDGVGMQSHFDTRQPLEGDNGYMTAVRTFRDQLGLEIHVTELDIGIAEEHTLEYQGEYFQKFMESLLQEKKDGANITSVTFWGISDNLSWRPNENCLLFNEDLSRKPAFDGVVKAINLKTVKDVKELIDGIGEVSLDSKEKIETARNAYNVLTEEQQKLVSAETLRILTEAENKYKEISSKAEEAEKTSIKQAVITTIPAQNYTGKTVTPAVIVTYNGNRLVNNMDYKLSYKDNKNIGTATVTITGKGDYVDSITETFQITVKKNKVYTVGNYKYKITNANTGGKGTVMLAGVKNSTVKKNLKSAKIADTANIGGKKFKITAIGSSALKGCKKLNSVTLGRNVKTIGSEAFSGDKKLGKIKFGGTAIKSIGKNAFKNIRNNAVFSVNKSKKAYYRKLLNKAKTKNFKVK